MATIPDEPRVNRGLKRALLLMRRERGKTPDIPTLIRVAPALLLSRASGAPSAPGDRPDLVRVEPADRLLIAIGESGNPSSRGVPAETGDEIAPDNC